MEFGQKFGTGLLMGIPAFVGSGLVFDLLHSWLAVFVWLALMPVVFYLIISGKLSGAKPKH